VITWRRIAALEEVSVEPEGPDTHGRRLVLVAGALFAASTAFPVCASLLREEQVALWVGVLDVGIAAAVLVMSLLVTRRAPPGDCDTLLATCTFHRLVWNVPLVLLLVFFIAGHSVRWNILLPGLAWRAWLLANVAPAAISVWKSRGTGAPTAQ
jgi:hypothetical protein